MEDVFYRFLQGAKHNYLSLSENEKNFVLYALSHGSVCKEELRCGFSVKEAFHFLCNDSNSIAGLSEKIDNIFKVFHVILSLDGKIRHLNLLNSVTFDSKNILLIFNLHNIDLWLLYKETEAQKDLEEWIKDEVDKLVQKNKEEAGMGGEDDSEEHPNSPFLDDYEITLAPQRLTVAIEDLDLSVRVFNWLKRGGISTVDELSEKTENEVKRLRPGLPLDENGLKEIRDQLHSIGLDFKKDGEDPSFNLFFHYRTDTPMRNITTNDPVPLKRITKDDLLPLEIEMLDSAIACIGYNEEETQYIYNNLFRGEDGWAYYLTMTSDRYHEILI